MKKLFKLVKFVFLVAFIFGGWALAAASLHVVRAPGSMLWNRVPLNVQFVPKNTLTFKDTYIDTTKWSVADVDAHPTFVDRLRQANKLNLIDQAKSTPANAAVETSIASSNVAAKDPGQPAAVAPSVKPAAADPTDSTPTTPEQPKPKSIFDFGK